MKKRHRRRSISSLKKVADKAFSIWIRQRDKECITCGSTRWLQAGHYVSRSWSNLRYDERNVNSQCIGCNIFKQGNMDVYALALKKKYGDGILEELAAMKVMKQFTPRELEDLIKKYAAKSMDKDF